MRGLPRKGGPRCTLAHPCAERAKVLFARKSPVGATSVRGHSYFRHVRRHLHSWRKPTPHFKAHPLVNRLNVA
jgi:hypothetical protein